MACHSYGMVPAALVIVLISVSIGSWATSSVRDNAGLKGEVEIGLWKACADMPCRDVNLPATDTDAAEASCSKPEVFADLGDCRYGHCIGGEDLTLFTSWNNNDLCNRSAAAGAFGIITILLIVYMAYLTTYRELRRPAGAAIGDGDYEKAAWVSLLATICAIICWATMKEWTRIMNDEKDERRSKETDSLQFDDLKTGLGMSLMLIAWLLLFANFIVCVVSAQQQGQAAKSSKRAPPAPGPQPIQSESANYLDVSTDEGYKPPPPAAMLRRNSTSSDV